MRVAVRSLPRGQRLGRGDADAVIAVARAARVRRGSPAALVRCLVSLQFDDRLNSAWEVAKERARSRREEEEEEKAKKGKKGVDADTARDLKEAEERCCARARTCRRAWWRPAFEVYFRLLKEFAAGKGGAANFSTLEAALAGLAKQAKYINVDFMADLFKCLFSMLPRPKAGAAGATGNGHSPGRTLPVRVQLRMILAIHAVLLGQGNALQVDQSFLVTAAMAAVQRVPFVGALEQAQAKVQAEGGQDSAQGARQQQRDAHASMLAVDVLDTVVSKLATGSRHYYQSTAHAAADASLHAPVGASLGSLAVVSRALAMPGICDTMLGNEGGGVEASLTGRMLAVQGAASSGSLWELTLLSRHFHPQVRSSAAGIAKMRAAKVAEGTQRPHDIAKQFDDSMGTFNPPLRPARAAGAGAGRGAGCGRARQGKGDDAIDAALVQAPRPIRGEVKPAVRHPQRQLSSERAGSSDHSRHNNIARVDGPPPCCHPPEREAGLATRRYGSLCGVISSPTLLPVPAAGAPPCGRCGWLSTRPWRRRAHPYYRLARRPAAASRRRHMAERKAAIRRLLERPPQGARTTSAALVHSVPPPKLLQRDAADACACAQPRACVCACVRQRLRPPSFRSVAPALRRLDVITSPPSVQCVKRSSWRCGQRLRRLRRPCGRISQQRFELRRGARHGHAAERRPPVHCGLRRHRHRGVRCLLPLHARLVEARSERGAHAAARRARRCARRIEQHHRARPRTERALPRRTHARTCTRAHARAHAAPVRRARACCRTCGVLRSGNRLNRVRTRAL